MRTRARTPRPGRLPFLAAATAGLLLLSSAPAGAAEDPVGQLLETVQQTVDGVVSPGGSTAPAPATVNESLTPVQDEDPDKEMSDPVSPDHAGADNATVTLADNHVASIGQTDSTIGDDDSSSADASALALGGNEIVGAHADGNQSSSAGDPLEPVCEQTAGALCVELVKAEAESSDANGAQSSHAATEVVGACVGGSDPTATECGGPVSAGVLTSRSDIQRGQDGHTRASSSSSVAEACLAPDTAAGGCTVGAEALSSSGESNSSGNTASKEATFLGLEIAGTPIAPIEDPTALEVAPDCPEGMQVACVFLLQGETYVGSAGHAITTLDANVLNGTVLATISHSETLVHKFPADVPPPGGPGISTGPAGPGSDADGAGPAGGDVAGGGVLPNTGGVLSGLLSLALFGVALGSFLVAWSRRVAMNDAPAAGGAWADGTA